MARRIRSIHPLCSFAFKQHQIKSIGSIRGGPVFVCSGYCLFDDCPVEVQITVQDKSSLKAQVTFSGGFVCHRLDQIKRRPVRANKRHTIAKTFSTKLPKSVFLGSMGKLDGTVVASGCRDQVPATGVMKTIS